VLEDQVVPSALFADALEGRLGAGALRLIASNPMPHGLDALLTRCWPERPDTVVPRLLRTKLKPARKLTASYALAAPPDGVDRHICVTWSLDPCPSASAPALEQEAARRGVLAPFVRLSAESEDPTMSLLAAPLDPVFPQLVRLYDPAHSARRLPSAAATRSSETPRCRVTTIRYRPGQRHSLRIAPATVGAAWTGGAIMAKAYRDGVGARTLEVAHLLGHRLALLCPDVTTPRPVGYDEEDRTVLWLEEAAEPLWHRLVRADAAPTAPFELVGRALRVVHETAWPAHLPTRGAAEVHAEVAATVRAAEHICTLLPSTGARLREVAQRVAVLTDSQDIPEPATTHGDLKCDNLLAANGRVCLIDLDRAALGDPSLDLGRFLADVRWWGAVLGTDTTPHLAAFRAGYGRSAAGLLARAEAVSILFQLKLAARRFPVHERDWAARVTTAVRQADAATRGAA
jgi:aminoglycoside phosphotransferase (APT) family kinase protein